MNIQERIKALETEFNERLKALKAEVQRGDEFPQDGEDYWLISGEGRVTYTMFTDNHVDRGRKEVGNIFQTRGQAEFAIEKLKVEAELRKFGRPFECRRFNHYIFLDTDSDCLDVDSLSYGQSQGTIYFETKKIAQQAIKSVGIDRIKKYLFGVEG